MLKRIASERARLVKEGKIRTGKPLPPVGADEAPFEVPEGWVWCRLGDVTSKIGAGSTPLGGARAYVPVGTMFLRSQNVWNDGLRLEDVARINSETHARMSGTHVSGGDLVFNITGASIGRCAKVPRDFESANVSQHVSIVRPTLPEIQSYLHLALISNDVQDQVHAQEVGISREGLSVGKLAVFWVPLPPLAEQHRIVARVDELMALLDRLEAARGARDTTRLAARDSALAALRDAADASEVAAAWRRLEAPMDDLFQAPEDVPPLRQAILQLAVRGKLVPQDPGDEPASELLKRIASERARLVKEGKIRAGKTLPPVGADAAPFEVPVGWVWTLVQNVGDIKLGRQRSPQNHLGPFMVPYLRVANVKEAELDLRDVKRMNFTPDEQATFGLKRGDVLLNEGQSLELVGRPALYSGEVPGACFQNTLIRVRCHGGCLAEYALAYFRHCLHSGRFQEAAQRTTNIAHLSASRLAVIEFPLPPLAEQHRIVARVDELMALCDRLESRLAAAREAQTALAAAAVHHIAQPDFAA